MFFCCRFTFFIIIFFNLANESRELMAAGVSHEAYKESELC